MTILVLSNLYPPDFVGGYEVACATSSTACAPRPRRPRPDRRASAPRRGDGRTSTGGSSSSTSGTPTAMGSQPGGASASTRSSRATSAPTTSTRWPRRWSSSAPRWSTSATLVGLGGLGLMACLQYLGVPWVWQLGDMVPNILCSSGGPAGARTWLGSSRRHVRGPLRRRQPAAPQRDRDGRRGAAGPRRGDPQLDHRRPAAVARRRTTGADTSASCRPATVSRHKGTDIVIEAAGRLREAGLDDFSVDIYGKASDRYFAYLIRKLGLERHVTPEGRPAARRAGGPVRRVRRVRVPDVVARAVRDGPAGGGGAGMRAGHVADLRDRRVPGPRRPLPQGGAPRRVVRRGCWPA